MNDWRRGFAAFAFFIFACLHLTFAEQLSSIRDRDTPAGLYESNYAEAYHGRLVAPLDELSIRKYFESQSPESFAVNAFDLETGNETKAEDSSSRKILYVVGLPLFGKERQETLNLVKELSGEKRKSFTQWLRDLFYFDTKNTTTHIRPIGRPTGKWKVLQQLAYPMIWPSDMMPVDKAVLKQGIQSVIISSVIGLSIQLMVQLGERGDLLKALAVVLPTAAINLIQSAWTSLPRNWWQNYFKRSSAIAAPLIESVAKRSPQSDRVGRIFGSVAQQLWMTFFFTFNVYLVSRGDWQTSLGLLSMQGLYEVFIKKWPSMLMNVLWRTPTENAFADYVENESNKGRGNQGDLEAAKIRKFVTILATNLWVYSTLTTMNLDFMGAKWNLGHAGLALISLIGIKAWMKPEIMRPLTKSGRCANQMEALTAKKSQ